MKISSKTWRSTVVAGTVALGLGLGAQADAADSYKATFYVAGMGGHFAKAEVTIDPAQETPIKLHALTKVDIGDRASHPTHDARIDVNDRNVMFWSTYQVDAATNKLHVGKTDLKTGKKIMDVDVDVPAEATKTKSMYCASGQSADYFLPISMAHRGYIDVFSKSDLKRTQRIFLEGTDADIKKPYKFYHGINSPDMKKLLVSINEADTDHGTTIGKLHLVTLDLPALTNGQVKVLGKGLATGVEKKTVSFRQYYSNDGKLIANSGGDRLFLIDADSLGVIDAEMMGALGEENHDAIFTPDDNYVIATARTKVVQAGCKDPQNPGPDEFLMDGTLRLYDVKAKKFIGKSTSVCLACHDKEGLGEHAVLCGLDANWSNI